jgi:hypothetical protein
MDGTGREAGTRRVAPKLVLSLLLAVSMAACGGGSDDRPTATLLPRVSATPSPTPVIVGTGAVARWAGVWRDAFQQFADDLSTIAQALRNRDSVSLQDALGRLPGDAHEAVRKIDDAGAVPPGLRDEARDLRGLVDQAARLAPRLADDCLPQAGLSCAADAAGLLSVVGQMLDALKPFGVDIRFRVDL